MQSFFATFIKNGNQNSDKVPFLPAAGEFDQMPPVMIIDTISHIEKAPDNKRYVLLDKIIS